MKTKYEEIAQQLADLRAEFPGFSDMLLPFSKALEMDIPDGVDPVEWERFAQEWDLRSNQLEKWEHAVFVSADDSPPYVEGLSVVNVVKLAKTKSYTGYIVIDSHTYTHDDIEGIYYGLLPHHFSPSDFFVYTTTDDILSIFDWNPSLAKNNTGMAHHEFLLVDEQRKKAAYKQFSKTAVTLAESKNEYMWLSSPYQKGIYVNNGGAGSGKTTVLIQTIIDYVEQCKREPEAVHLPIGQHFRSHKDVMMLIIECLPDSIRPHVMHVEGRSASTCMRYTEIQPYQIAKHNIEEHFCKKCPLRAECAYQTQMKRIDEDPTLYVLLGTHQSAPMLYLPHHDGVDPRVKPLRLYFDEDPSALFLQSYQLSKDNFLTLAENAKAASLPHVYEVYRAISKCFDEIYNETFSKKYITLSPDQVYKYLLNHLDESTLENAGFELGTAKKYNHVYQFETVLRHSAYIPTPMTDIFFNWLLAMRRNLPPVPVIEISKNKKEVFMTIRVKNEAFIQQITQIGFTISDATADLSMLRRLFPDLRVPRINVHHILPEGKGKATIHAVTGLPRTMTAINERPETYALEFGRFFRQTMASFPDRQAGAMLVKSLYAVFTSADPSDNKELEEIKAYFKTHLKMGYYGKDEKSTNELKDVTLFFMMPFTPNISAAKLDYAAWTGDYVMERRAYKWIYGPSGKVQRVRTSGNSKFDEMMLARKQAIAIQTFERLRTIHKQVDYDVFYLDAADAWPLELGYITEYLSYSSPTKMKGLHVGVTKKKESSALLQQKVAQIIASMATEDAKTWVMKVGKNKVAKMIEKEGTAKRRTVINYFTQEEFWALFQPVKSPMKVISAPAPTLKVKISRPTTLHGHRQLARETWVNLLTKKRPIAI